MIKTVYVCDICGAERKEANHWFAAQQLDEVVRIYVWDAKSNGDVHLCGSVCVHSYVDKFLASFETKPPSPEVLPLVIAPPLHEIPEEKYPF